MRSLSWKTHNPSGEHRVIITKPLPGKRWLDILKAARCRVEISTGKETLKTHEIVAAMGSRCHGAIGQLTEHWGEELFSALRKAGGKVYSNYAVGVNNIDIPAATRHGIPVGNTPGVLTETTAQMAVALTFAAARRVGESERFLRSGAYQGWQPTLFLGKLLWRRTLGVVGAGRIGAAYARMMVEGHKMDLIYFDLHGNRELEEDIAVYGRYLQSRGEAPVTCTRMESVEAVARRADCLSLHTLLDTTTRHLIGARQLELMKENAVLINTSRGEVIDEAALVAHCQTHPSFKAGLDVFEDEPRLSPGLVELDNVVIVPHIASATRWTREGMATLAATNVAAVLMGYPASREPDMSPFLSDNPPRAAPSIVNAGDLKMA